MGLQRIPVRICVIAVMAVAIVVSWAASDAFAQQAITGSVSGYVFDPNGDPLPGVTVTIRDVSRGIETVKVTDQEGYFVFSTLSPSTYDMRVTLSGFNEITYGNVRVGPNSRVRLTFDMSTSVAVEETVTVTAPQPAIESTETAIKKTIEYEQFDNLPILSRDFQSIIDTLPGVTQTGSNFNIGGSRDNQNIFLIDGARNNDLTNTSGRFRDSVFYIVSNQNPEDPTVGLQTGYALQPFNQDAISEIQVVSSAYSAEFGQGSGGVINLITRSGTDFWSGGFTFNFQDESLSSADAFDDLRRTQESVFVGGPIARGSTWFFGSYERDDYDVGFDNRRIAMPGEATGGKIRSFILDTDLRQSETSKNRLTGKVTSQLSPNNTLNVTLNYSNDHSLFNQAINRPSLNEIEPRQGDNNTLSLLVNDYHTFSDASVLYSLFKISNLDRFSESLGSRTDALSLRVGQEQFEGQTVGEQPLIYSIDPVTGGAVFTDYYVIGAIGETLDANLTSFEWKETYTTQFGGHSVIAGFDWESFKEDLFVPARELFVSDNRDPSFTVIPVPVPAPLDSLWTFFSTGTPIDQQIDTTLNTISLFVQDDWTANPRFVFNLGLRYDYDDFLENHQFSPRLSAVYSLNQDSTLVLRAGAGVFRDRTTLLATEEATLVRSRGVNYDRATQAPSIDPTILPPQNVFLTDDFSSPRTIEGNVGLEWELADGYVVGGNFIYKDHDGLVWTQIINKRSATGGPPPDPSIPVDSKLIGNFGNLRDALVELTFRKNYAEGGFLNFNYTFEDTSGNSSQEAAARNETVVNAISDFDQLERSHPADFEVRHAFKASGGYDFPYDVRFSSILKWRTGRPWTPEERRATPFAHFVAPEGFNSRRLPNEFQWDIRAAKEFAVGDRASLEAYVDVFNLTNHENVRAVQRIITFANFAEPTAFLLPRTVQLGGKLRF